MRLRKTLPLMIFSVFDNSIFGGTCTYRRYVPARLGFLVTQRTGRVVAGPCSRSALISAFKVTILSPISCLALLKSRFALPPIFAARRALLLLAFPRPPVHIFRLEKLRLLRRLLLRSSSQSELLELLASLEVLEEGLWPLSRLRKRHLSRGSGLPH